MGVDMISASSNDPFTFTPGARAAFLEYLRSNPNNRRVSQSDKEILIEWLTNPNKRPLSQEEFSRRNYVRKTFAWNEESQTLRAVAKKGESKDRTVITTDMIADVVERCQCFILRHSAIGRYLSTQAMSVLLLQALQTSQRLRSHTSTPPTDRPRVR